MADFFPPSPQHLATRKRGVSLSLLPSPRPRPPTGGQQKLQFALLTKARFGSMGRFKAANAVLREPSRNETVSSVEKQANGTSEAHQIHIGVRHEVLGSAGGRHGQGGRRPLQRDCGRESSKSRRGERGEETARRHAPADAKRENQLKKNICCMISAGGSLVCLVFGLDRPEGSSGSNWLSNPC